MEIRQVIGAVAPVYEDALQLRKQVFVDEQGFPAATEIDDNDPQALHLVGYLQNQPVAVARMIFTSPAVAKIGRVAVAKSHRGLGLGKQLMHNLLAYAEQQQLRCVMLSAQLSAQDFYAQLGFTVQGDSYLEEGAPHIRMIYLFDSQ